MEIIVENIKCGGCANTIQNSILKIDGVNDVNVDINTGKIKLNTNHDVSRETIVSKLHSMGYPEPGKGSKFATATSFLSCMIGKITS